MLILIKYLTRRSGGRESIRTEEVRTDSLTIGRGTDNDVQLPDIRVALHHATLTERSPGRLRIAAEGDKAVRVGRSNVKTRDFPADKPFEFHIGPYALTVEAGAEERIVVVAERVEALTPPARPEDEEKLFTLRGSWLGKRAAAWALFLVIGAMFLAIPLALSRSGADDVGAATTAAVTQQSAFAGTPVSDRSWLSGPMTHAHANLTGQCAACHVKPFEPVQDTACLTCHEGLGNHADPADLEASMPPVVGFGATLHSIADSFGHTDGRCSTCHQEHNGEALLPSSDSTCIECHRDLDVRLTATDLLNESDFGRDHPEFRPTLLTRPEPGVVELIRASLADFPTEQSGLKFPHDIHLDPDSQVSEQARELAAANGFGETLVCADCHTADAGGVLFEPIVMEQDCGMCHSLAFAEADGATRVLRHGEPQEVAATLNDFYLARALTNVQQAANTTTRRRPGSGATIRQADLREQAFAQAQQRTVDAIGMLFSEGGTCFECHQVTNPADDPMSVEVAPVMLTDRFLPHGAFDHASHETANLTCESCHDARSSETAEEVLLPGVAVCRDCHGGPGQAMLVPSDCGMCHAYHSDTGPLMGPVGLALR